MFIMRFKLCWIYAPKSSPLLPLCLSMKLGACALLVTLLYTYFDLPERCGGGLNARQRCPLRSSALRVRTKHN